MEIAKPRPPYIAFETRPVEDRNASIEAGHYVAVDVDYVLITPAGSKDRVEKVVSEWFPQLSNDVRAQRFPAEWLEAYRSAYTQWKSTGEIPTTGTAIASWPVLSPAQVRNLRELHVRTVEDLAAANEELIGRLGMGGRSLKQRAVEWLEAAKNVGAVSEKVTGLQQQLADAQAVIAQQTDLLNRQAAVIEQFSVNGAAPTTGPVGDPSEVLGTASEFFDMDTPTAVAVQPAGAAARARARAASPN